MNKLPNIVSTTIPHRLQAYDTAGDYYSIEDKAWIMYISESGDWRYDALVFIHEFVEMCLTKNNNVDWDKITQFDTTGDGQNHPDPGTLENAPYHNEHMSATAIERLFAEMIGIDFDKYDEHLGNLEYPQLEVAHE